MQKPKISKIEHRCPFCGGESALLTTYWAKHNETECTLQAECKECAASGPAHYSCPDGVGPRMHPDKIKATQAALGAWAMETKS